jgi:hypothetical protein
MTSGLVGRSLKALLEHRKVAGRLLAMVSVAAIMFATLLPSSQRLTSTRWCIVCGSLGGVDVVLNVLLFVPLGVGLAMAGMRPLRAIASMILLTFTIETLQFALIHGRDASIGDLLTNSAGGAIGFAVGSSIDKWMSPSPGIARWLIAAWLCVWVSMQAVSGYSLVPAPSGPVYYGQIRPSLEGRQPYAGEVLRATIGGVPVPNTSYERAGLPAPAFSSAEGPIVRIDLVSRGPTRRLVPIVRIVAGTFDEVLLVGQHGTSLVFGVRSGAAKLHLRPVYFALRDVFPRSRVDAGRDTIHVEAQYRGREVQIEAAGGEVHRGASIPVSPAAGLRLFLPFHAYADGKGREWILTPLWLVLLLAPIGYWYSWSVRRESRERPAKRGPAVLLIALVVLAGLAGVPAVLGLAQPGVTEWGGVVFALAAGALAGRLCGASYQPSSSATYR